MPHPRSSSLTGSLPEPGGVESALPLAAACAAIALLAASYCGLYRLPELGHRRVNLRRVSVVAGMMALTLWIALALVRARPARHPHEPAGRSHRVAGHAAPARITGAQIARLPALRHRVLLIGTGELCERLMAALDTARWHRFRGGGRAHACGDADIIGSRRVIGQVEDLSKVLQRLAHPGVIVAEPSADAPLPMDLLVEAKIAGVPVESGLRVDEALSERVPLHELRPEDIVFEDGFAPRRSYAAISRAVDIASGIIGLLLFAPLLLLAMLAIRIESPGSPIFWQRRTGRGGRNFRVCKLRSMRDDAEAQTGAVLRVRHGRRPRHQGRPHPAQDPHRRAAPAVERAEGRDEPGRARGPSAPSSSTSCERRIPTSRCATRSVPGSRGWRRSGCGYVNDLESWGPKLAHDLYYVKHRSLRLDLDIILGTTRTVLLMRGV